MYAIAQVYIHTNFAALHIFSQVFLRREYCSVIDVCTKCFKENIKDRNTLLFLWCLKGMVISYSFKTLKKCMKAGHFTFCCTWKAKLQRYPHILFIRITFLSRLHTWKWEVCPTKVFESFYFLCIWPLEHVGYISFLFFTTGCSDSHFMAVLFIFKEIIPEKAHIRRSSAKYFLYAWKEQASLQKHIIWQFAGVHVSVISHWIFQFGF